VFKFIAYIYSRSGTHVVKIIFVNVS